VGVEKVAKNGRRMKTGPAWEHDVMIDEATRRVRCNYCPQEFSRGAYRLKPHLAGAGKDAKSCVVAEAEVAADSNGKSKSVREISRKDMFKRGVTTLT
ncbi:DNA binding protein, partial [Trifolium pratense]